MSFSRTARAWRGLRSRARRRAARSCWTSWTSTRRSGSDLAARTPPPLEWIYRREARSLGAFEAMAATRAAATLVVNDREAAAGARACASRERAGGVQRHRRREFPSDGAALSDGRAWSSAASWTMRRTKTPRCGWLRDIWPAVRAANPSATLTLMGPNPTARLTSACAADPTIEITGRVADVRPDAVGLGRRRRSAARGARAAKQGPGGTRRRPADRRHAGSGRRTARGSAGWMRRRRHGDRLFRAASSSCSRSKPQQHRERAAIADLDRPLVVHDACATSPDSARSDRHAYRPRLLTSRSDNRASLTQLVITMH